MYIAEPGDILLYRNPSSTADKLVIYGEILEDGKQDREYYHVAIAINANDKIEAYGRNVGIYPIDYGNFDAFRPPIDKVHVSLGIDAIMKCVGQPYDWLLIIDDALRFISRGVIHLPRKLVEKEERTHKICSSLAAYYLRQAGWTQIRSWPTPTPEDIYLAVKNYPVPC